jgi:hypothetical protein
MSEPTTDSLRAALCAIGDPSSGKDIVTAGLVESVQLKGGLVQVSLLTDRAHAEAMESRCASRWKRCWPRERGSRTSRPCELDLGAGPLAEQDEVAGLGR